MTPRSQGVQALLTRIDSHRAAMRMAVVFLARLCRRLAAWCFGLQLARQRFARRTAPVRQAGWVGGSAHVLLDGLRPSIPPLLRYAAHPARLAWNDCGSRDFEQPVALCPIAVLPCCRVAVLPDYLAIRPSGHPVTNPPQRSRSTHANTAARSGGRGALRSEVNRDRGQPSGRAPPTPPGVRVRTGRFERLRSGEFGHS